uniref:RNA methyltransferase n=1 Tax=Syphacia muris TaxID=451379 RepID=A0A0N5ALM6_9BILA
MFIQFQLLFFHLASYCDARECYVIIVVKMNGDNNEAGSSMQDVTKKSSKEEAFDCDDFIQEHADSDEKRKEESHVSRVGGGSRNPARGHKRRMFPSTYGCTVRIFPLYQPKSCKKILLSGDKVLRTRRWRGGSATDGLPFLHGGNIKDPLNLESVKPEEECETYEPLEIIIPKNPRDPLNLKKIIKNRNKRKRRNSKLYGEDSNTTTAESSGAPLQQVSTGHSVDDRPVSSPIVSPVPVSLVRKFNKQSARQKVDLDDEEKRKFIETEKKMKQKKMQQKNEKLKIMKIKFRYGNFSRYYGFRIGQGSGKDPRLFAFKKEWFEKKTVLDIGCNAGYVTLWIAKEFSPRYILGIDIDQHLVGVARKNIRHYCDKNIQIEGKFPASFASRYGPISFPSITFSSKFPNNVWFRQENYVLDYDEYLDSVKQEFDVILALSITKWIHLNWGDSGIKRFFKRIFLHLRPGGKLFLEPQGHESYYRRAKMNADLMENYKKLKFLPDSFKEYLLHEVGFESVEELDVPKAKTKGFDRPIQVYKKKLFFEHKENATIEGNESDISLTNVNAQQSNNTKSPDGPGSPKRAKHIIFDD